MSLDDKINLIMLWVFVGTAMALRALDKLTAAVKELQIQAELTRAENRAAHKPTPPLQASAN